MGAGSFCRTCRSTSSRLERGVLPAAADREQLAIMELADRETERWRRKFGMSAPAVRAHGRGDGHRLLGDRHGPDGRVRQLRLGAQHRDDRRLRPRVGRQEGAREPLRTCPGEFIFDVQSHHVDPDGMWRVTNPAFHAFFAAVWPQASPVLGGSLRLRAGRLAPRRRRGRDRPDREPLALPLPQGALPRLGHDDDGALGGARPRRTPTTRCRSPRPRRRSTPSTSSRGSAARASCTRS